MNWHKNLYVGSEANRKKKKIIRKLDSHSIALGVYVITLASNGRDLFDVLPAYMLYRDKVCDREIIGIAVTKEEALEVCGQIIMDAYIETGEYDVRSFLS